MGTDPGFGVDANIGLMVHMMMAAILEARSGLREARRAART
jgi:hypothetical protein